jgi:integrase
MDYEPSGELLTKSWIFRYRFGGKHRAMGLGSTRWMDLKEARDAARGNLRLLKVDRVDPLEARKAAEAAQASEARKVTTFRQAAERYIKAHEGTWKNPKHAAQWPATLERYVYPHFGDMSVAAINVGLVLKAIEPIWADKPETAGRVRGRIEAVLDWASARGLRSSDNPARWKGHLDKLLPGKAKVRKVEHHAALPYAQIGGFLADLRGMEGLAARALQFTILTAARTGEVIGARWPEIDFKTAVWTVPAERMKAGREHKVPLPATVLEIIRPLYDGRAADDSYIFAVASNKGLSGMAMLMLLRRMERGDVTVHGFRSAFRDWAAERTNFAREVAEAALAHTIGDKVEAAYRRSDLFDKRKQLANAWARFCVTPSAAGSNAQKIGGAR